MEQAGVRVREGHGVHVSEESMEHVRVGGRGVRSRGGGYEGGEHGAHGSGSEGAGEYGVHESEGQKQCRLHHDICP